MEMIEKHRYRFMAMCAVALIAGIVAGLILSPLLHNAKDELSIAFVLAVYFASMWILVFILVWLFYPHDSHPKGSLSPVGKAILPSKASMRARVKQESAGLSDTIDESLMEIYDTSLKTPQIPEAEVAERFEREYRHAPFGEEPNMVPERLPDLEKLKDRMHLAIQLAEAERIIRTIKARSKDIHYSIMLNPKVGGEMIYDAVENYLKTYCNE